MLMPKENNKDPLLLLLVVFLKAAKLLLWNRKLLSILRLHQLRQEQPIDSGRVHSKDLCKLKGEKKKEKWT